MTRVVLPGVLRSAAGGAAALDLVLGDEATVADLLDAIAADHPALARRVRDERGELRRFVNVYIDGEDARVCGGVHAAVPATAEVLLLPSIAGGSAGVPAAAVRPR